MLHFHYRTNCDAIWFFDERFCSVITDESDLNPLQSLFIVAEVWGNI